MKFGLVATNHRFTPDALVIRDNFDGSYNIDRKTEYKSLETGLYIEDEWKISKRLKSLHGLRLSTFSSEGTTYVKPEPRIGLAYALRKDLSMKASLSIQARHMQFRVQPVT